MFITKEQIAQKTGITVEAQTLQVAQFMIEAWVGKTEAEIDSAGNLAILANATAFQAIYLGNSTELILEQAAIKSIVANESTTVFDTDMFSPFMSPMAVLTCRKLSWMGSR